MTAIEEARRLPPEVRAEVEAQALARLLDILEEASLDADIGAYAWLDGRRMAVKPEAVQGLFAGVAEKFVTRRPELFTSLDIARADAAEARRELAPARERAERLEKHLRKLIHLIDRCLPGELAKGRYDPVKNRAGWAWRADYDAALQALLPDGV